MSIVPPQFDKLTKVLALDCEMVGIVRKKTKNTMIARVSLVNEDGICVYDTFVKPRRRIVDYRTEVSGITPGQLERGVEYITMRDTVVKMLKGRIVVGHSVKLDLRVVGYSHKPEKTKDITKFEAFQVAGQDKVSLKDLVKEFLGTEIQNGPHDSVTDARATMALYMLVVNGKVIDYRTRVSGVRPCDLQNGDDFNEVKKVVTTMLRGRILVGHSVDKDLRVLGCCHPDWNIRDTTEFEGFQVRRNGKPSLKYLARRFLGMEIQNGAHNSVIDARATMRLYQLVAEDWEASSEESDSEQSNYGNHYNYDSDSSSD